MLESDSPRLTQSGRSKALAVLEAGVLGVEVAGVNKAEEEVLEVGEVESVPTDSEVTVLP